MDFASRAERGNDNEGQIIRALEEQGALRHLYGRPLDLEGDIEYLANKTLKSQGFTHPILERARELDAPRREAEEVLERLGRRRQWLADRRSGSTPQQRHAFNDQRRERFVVYREKLEALNRAIRDYNLGAPEVLHQRPVRIERALQRAGEEIPPLELEPLRENPPRSGMSRLLRRFRQE